MKANRTQTSIRATLIALSLLFGLGIAASTTGRAQGNYGYPQDQRTRDERNRDYRQNGRGGYQDGYGDYGGSFELRQTALNAGYNEGLKDFGKNRDKNRRLDYRDQKTYQQATKDYSSRLGDRELYRRYFREAYANGYNAYNPNVIAQGGRNRDYRTNNDNNGNYGNNDSSRNDTGNLNRRGRNWDRYDNYGGSFELRQTALNAGYNEGIKVGRNDRKKGRSYQFQNQSAYQEATKDYSSRLGDRELYRRYYREGYQNGYDAGYKGY